MINPLHNTLDIEICQDAGEAIQRGYIYGLKGRGEKPVRVKKVVVIKVGTEEGNPTVDFILEDETGQEFVFFVTGRLLKSIPC